MRGVRTPETDGFLRRGEKFTTSRELARLERLL